MPRFFFDIQDGNTSNPDEQGSELDNLDQIREQSLDMLSHLIEHGLAKGQSRECSVTVKDERGTELNRATLTFTEEHFARQTGAGS